MLDQQTTEQLKTDKPSDTEADYQWKSPEEALSFIGEAFRNPQGAQGDYLCNVLPRICEVLKFISGASDEIETIEIAAIADLLDQHAMILGEIPTLGMSQVFLKIRVFQEEPSLIHTPAGPPPAPKVTLQTSGTSPVTAFFRMAKEAASEGTPIDAEQVARFREEARILLLGAQHWIRGSANLIDEVCRGAGIDGLDARPKEQEASTVDPG